MSEVFFHSGCHTEHWVIIKKDEELFIGCCQCGKGLGPAAKVEQGPGDTHPINLGPITIFLSKCCEDTWEISYNDGWKITCSNCKKAPEGLIITGKVMHPVKCQCGHPSCQAKRAKNN